MKLLHVSDLHLDTPFSGIAKQDYQLQQKLIQAPFESFERCVSIAINQKIDLMLVSGDIYDATKQTIAAKHFFFQQMNRLKQAEIPVVIGHGNHDYYEPNYLSMNYPDNVFLFEEELVKHFDITTKNNETIRIYGFSYNHRWIKERMIEKYPINPRATDFTIGLLHGSLDSTENEHANYAPFSLQDLLSKEYDYWALGHIHQAMVLNEVPLIQYPGIIQGKNAKESGDKGAYIVELRQNQPTLNEFVSLASIVWETANLYCDYDWDQQRIISEIQDIVTNYEAESEGTQQSYLLTIHLNDAHKLSNALQEQIESGQLSEVFQPNYEAKRFTKVVKIKLLTDNQLEVFEYDPLLNESYLATLQEFKDGELYDTVIKEITKHPVMRKWLKGSILTEDLKNDALEKANQRLLQTLSIESEEDNHEN